MADVSIIGVPNDRWGESGVVVVLRNTHVLDEAEFLAFCGDKLARYEHPKGVWVVDELPRNVTVAFSGD